ncbi:hypothetical protein FGG08_007097, partial [Glutinoglossum americanum]
YHNGRFVSILPLLAPECGVTHVNIAAIHLNERYGDVTLNDDPYSAPKYNAVWEEVRILQSHGIKVLGMLGGAAPGTYTRLDRNADIFNSYYEPLRDMIKWCGLDGIDLDVEEHMSLAGITRLIDRLKLDFGADFILTLAPVAPGMWGGKHMSGFSYDELEITRGSSIAWYNTMFYCGWGSMETTEDFDKIIDYGWPAERIVIGLSTNPETSGWIHGELLRGSLGAIVEIYPVLGGVMGWEYFNSITVAEPSGEQPWCWAQLISEILHLKVRDVESSAQDKPCTAAQH